MIPVPYVAPIVVSPAIPIISTSVLIPPSVFRHITEGGPICRVLFNPNDASSETMHGTGFLCKIPSENNNISGLITCAHVLPGVTENVLAKCTFDFGAPIGTKNAKDIIASDRMHYSSQEKNLDFTFLSLNESFMKDLNSCKRIFLEVGAATVGETVSIKQYPFAGPAKIADGRITKINYENNEFEHQVSTDKGSSGAPVINDKGEVVGMHHGASLQGQSQNGDRLQRNATYYTENINLAINITAIVEYMHSQSRTGITIADIYHDNPDQAN